MSYTTKYMMKVYDIDGGEYELHLQQDGYSGGSYYMNGSSNPIIVSDQSHGESKFKEMRTTVLKASLVIDMEHSSYDFDSDFNNVTEREWRAILYDYSVSTYKSTVGITTLNITNTSSDATGSIEITATGSSFSGEVECLLDLGSTLDLPGTDDDSYRFTLYAVPETEGIDSPNAIIISRKTVSSASISTVEDVIDAFAADSDITKVSSTSLKHIPESYIDINADYQLKIQAEYEREYKWNIIYFWVVAENPFTGKTYYNYNQAYEPHWIEVRLVEANESETQKEIVIARHEYESGETLSSVASDLQSQLDGLIYENVFIDILKDSSVDDGIRTIKIQAEITSANAAKIELTLLELGADGNGIEIQSTQVNETYIRVVKKDGSSYTFSTSNFSGGDDGGDTFLYEVEEDSTGFQTIGQAKAYSGDAIADILERLRDDIIANNEDYTPELDPNDNTQLLVYNEKGSGYNYKLTTDGGSTTDPSSAGFDTFTQVAGETQTLWQGYVLTDFYERPRLPGNIPLVLKAYDALKDLKNIDFEFQNTTVYQKVSLMSILVDALSSIGFNLRIYDATDAFEVHHDTGRSSLAQTYVQAIRYNGKDAYSTIESIMKTFGTVIRQRKGRWEIIPIGKLHETSIRCNIYSYRGQYVETVDIDNTIEVGGHDSDNLFVYASGLQRYNKPYKKIISNQDFGVVAQILQFPKFQNFSKANAYNLQYPWNWTLAGVIRSDYLGEIYLQNEVLYIEDDSEHVGNRYELIQNFEIERISGQYKTGDYDYQFSIEILESAFFEIKLKLTDGTDTLYLQLTDEFVESETYIGMFNASKSAKTIKYAFNYPSGFSADTAQATLYIRQPDSSIIDSGDITRCAIKNTKIEIKSIQKTGQRIESYYEDYHTNLFTEDLEISFELGDVPKEFPNSFQIMKNALYYLDENNDYQLTSTWFTDINSPEYESLIDITRKRYLKQYATNQALLDAQIQGGVQMFDIINDTLNGNMKMIPTGGDWDIRKKEYNGEFHQLLPDEPSGDSIISKKVVLTESTGSLTYTTEGTPTGGGDDGGDIDLSEYLKENEINALIEGDSGTFTGADLDNRQIVISHTKGDQNIIVVLGVDNKQITNFTITNKSTGVFTLTVNYPHSAGTEFTYRIL
jgi:hypothetical protein